MCAILSLFTSVGLIAQEETCECSLNESFIRICYTADADYCVDPGSGICGYTLDGRQMEGGLLLKLQNLQNFGPQGASDCIVSLHPLKKDATKEDIYLENCNIVFIGNHPYDPETGFTDLSRSALSDDMLSGIREWSIECERNLVIATQAEANLWGYRVENQNVNPNFPEAGESPIFDGPFGQIPIFEQGGTYQGIFVETPSTGNQVLGVDNTGRPTMVLDNATNDILLGDVGIFCSFAGEVTLGNGIVSNNDILAANIFALGCSIVEGTFRNFIPLWFCEGESYTLPSGLEVDDDILYVDSLIGSNGCDSLDLYVINFEEHDTIYISYEGCAQDGYFVEVNGEIFDYDNRTGSHSLQNQAGCDSTILVDLNYFDSDTIPMTEEICQGETFTFDGQDYDPGQIYNIPYTNINGCDSTIFLDLQTFPEAEVSIQESVVVVQNQALQMEHEIPASALISWTPAIGLSCDDCPKPVILPDFFNESYLLEIEDEYGCYYQYPIQVSYRCEPLIPNIFSSKSDGVNGSFYIEPICPVSDYYLRIYSRWGEEVFSTTDSQEFWNGKFNGVNSTPGVYVYHLQYNQNGEKFEDVGTITLL